MKKHLVFFILLVTLSTNAIAQLKKFDANLLKTRTLYIPEFDENSVYAKKLIKKGKSEKLKKLQNYSDVWKKAMAQSSYDATPYEIRKFDKRKLIKEKNNKAIVLFYRIDQYGNKSANLLVTGPKRILISQANINGLDLSDENDVRLMMNMLNYSLNELAEVDEKNGSIKYRDIKKKYYENLASFHSNMDEMTFLVPASNHKNPKKAAERDTDLKAALKGWNISKHKFVTTDEIEKLRLAGDSDSFYWKTFKIYTNSPLISYNMNFIITTEKDEPIFAFLGTKRLKPKTLSEIQVKIAKRAQKGAK